MQYNVTFSQFQSLLGFLAIICPNTETFSHSPDYLLEKFEAHLGNPDLIPSYQRGKRGVHELLRSEVIDKYVARWHLSEDNFRPSRVAA